MKNIKAAADWLCERMKEAAMEKMRRAEKELEEKKRRSTKDKVK